MLLKGIKWCNFTLSWYIFVLYSALLYLTKQNLCKQTSNHLLLAKVMCIYIQLWNVLITWNSGFQFLTTPSPCFCVGHKMYSLKFLTDAGKTCWESKKQWQKKYCKIPLASLLMQVYSTVEKHVIRGSGGNGCRKDFDGNVWGLLAELSLRKVHTGMWDELIVLCYMYKFCVRVIECMDNISKFWNWRLVIAII